MHWPGLQIPQIPICLSICGTCQNISNPRRPHPATYKTQRIHYKHPSVRQHRAPQRSYDCALIHQGRAVLGAQGEPKIYEWGGFNIVADGYVNNSKCMQRHNEIMTLMFSVIRCVPQHQHSSHMYIKNVFKWFLDQNLNLFRTIIHKSLRKRFLFSNNLFLNLSLLSTAQIIIISIACWR